jgi:hypothetical protein
VNKTSVKKLKISEKKPHDFLPDDKCLLKQALTCSSALGEYTSRHTLSRIREASPLRLPVYWLRAEKSGVNKRTVKTYDT